MEKGTFNFDFYLVTVKADRRQQIIFKIFYIRSQLVNKRKKERKRGIKGIDCPLLSEVTSTPLFSSRNTIGNSLCAFESNATGVISQATTKYCRLPQRSTENH